VELSNNIVYINAITLLVGIGVFVGGQVIAKFLIEPIHQQRRAIGKAAHAVWFYANVWSNPRRPGESQDADLDEVRHDAYTALRQAASQLMAATNAIPMYGVWQCLPWFPQWSELVEVWGDLVLLSNGVYGGDPIKHSEAAGRVYSRLRIKTKA
jgi:hypothetical protein